MKRRVQTRPKRVKGEDQFFTNPELAERIAGWANIENGRILEPSAGDGSLAIPLLKKPGVTVTCVEYDTVVAARLKKKLEATPEFEGRFKVYADDFLAFKPPVLIRTDFAAKQYPFDLVVMNPPYGSKENRSVGLAHRHVAHALEFAIRVIVLCASSFEFGKRANELIFSKAHMRRRVVLVKRPGFHGPHNKGIQPQRDYTVMEFVVGSHDRYSGEVDTERWVF